MSLRGIFLGLAGAVILGGVFSLYDSPALALLLADLGLC